MYLIVIRIEVQAIDTHTHIIIKNIDPTSIYKRAKETGRYDKTTLTTRTLTTYDNIKSKSSELCHTATETKTKTKKCVGKRERERQTERLAEMRARDKHTQEMPRKDRDGQNTHLNPFIQGTGSIHSNEVKRKPVLWEIIIL